MHQVPIKAWGTFSKGSVLCRKQYCVQNIPGSSRELMEHSITSRIFQGAHGAWHHFRPLETCWCAVCSVLTLPSHSLVTLHSKWNIPPPRDSAKEKWFDIRKPVAWVHICHYCAVSCMRQFPSFAALDVAMKYFSPWSKTGKSHLEALQQKMTEGYIVPWGIGWLAELYELAFQSAALLPLPHTWPWEPLFSYDAVSCKTRKDDPALST